MVFQHVSPVQANLNDGYIGEPRGEAPADMLLAIFGGPCENICGVLHFQRCDRFYEITNENLELAACRQELEAASSFAVIVLESARRSEGVGGEIASKRRLLVPTQPFEALQTPLQRP